MSQETWTVKRLLEWTEDFLRKKQIEQPRLEAQILLAHALGCKKIDLYVKFAELVPDAPKATFRDLVKKRSEGMPTAYLVGYRDFYSLTFQVTPAVLIPRPDTETLVVETINQLKAHPGPRILDLGTGSGCIAISLAKNLPKATVVAVDQSREALAVAKANATKIGVADRIEFCEGNWLAPVAAQTFDAIVSNPPYISAQEMEAVDPSVKNYEPLTALAGGSDGLEAYRAIVAQVPGYLKPGGLLAFEIGYTQEKSVRELIALGAQFDPGPTFNDMGGHPRVVTARRRAI